MGARVAGCCEDLDRPALYQIIGGRLTGICLSSIHTTTAILQPRVLIHGQEGVGKTTIAAKFPVPIFLQTEDGCPAGLSISTFGLICERSGPARSYHRPRFGAT